jgi:hypothetical protein
VSNWCRRAAGGAFLLAAGALGARIAAQDAPAHAEPAKVTKLFASDSIFSITIASDIKKYMNTRDSTAPALPGRLIVGNDTLKIGLRPRGHFRRKSSSCSFPPVSVQFGKDTKGTIFAKQKKLKLVTTCWPGRADYEGYIPQEYLLYRVYNLLTPLSFRARFVNVTYADTAHPDRAPIVTRGFFLEDHADMAARNAGSSVSAKNAGRDDFDPALLGLMSLFEFMIANTDWSLAAMHNMRFVGTAGTFPVVYYPVAYDFDWSGAVNARYATPDASLPIRSVRNRLWSSFCFTPAELADAIKAFNAQRPAITALYTDDPLLDQKAAASTLAYFDEFYQIINDPSKLTKEIKRHCAG